MKNLRKVLALVLVVATLMGFAAVASAKFEDAAKVKNEEAVELLAALNIINGYEVAEGKFEYRPEALVTRAEMAKMIYVILNGGTDDKAEDYKAACSYADAASTWAAGYIAWCEQEGIIAGYADGSYKPSKNISVLEAAKMALCAMGYDSKNAGFEGSAWSKNVNTAAGKAKLYKEVTQSGNATITRQNAAQILLNALKAETVEEKTSDINISINGTSITGETKKEYKTTGNTLVAEQFGGEISVQESATAAGFGAPQYEILLGGSVKATVAYKPVATLTGVVTVADVYAAVNQKTIAGAVVTVDGEDASAADLANAWSTTKATADAAKKVALSGNAATVEVYLTEAGKVYAIVKNLYLGRVGAYDSTNKNYAFYDYLVPGTNGHKYSVNIKNEAKLADLVLYNKDLSKSAAADQIVLLSKYNNGQQVSGKVTGLTGTGAGTIDTIAVNGVKYTFAEKVTNAVAGELSGLLGMDVTMKVEGTEILYIQGTAAAAPTVYVAYLMATQVVTPAGTGWSDASAADSYTNGKLLVIDGTGKVSTEIVKLTADSETTTGKLYEYTISDKNEYKLANDATQIAVISTETELKAQKLGNYIVNNDTLYVVQTNTAKAGEAASYKYEGYVGSVKAPAVKSSNIIVYYKAQTINGTEYKIAQRVYVMDAQAVETVVTADAAYGIVLKTDADAYEYAKINDVLTQIYTVKAYIDGKAATLKVTAAEYATLSAVTYITEVKTEAGLSDVTVFSASDALKAYEVDVAYTKGIVIGTLAGAQDVRNIDGADAAVYAYGSDSKTFATKKFSELTKDFAGFAVLDKNGAIVLLVGSDKF